MSLIQRTQAHNQLRKEFDLAEAGLLKKLSFNDFIQNTLLVKECIMMNINSGHEDIMKSMTLENLYQDYIHSPFNT